MGSYFRQDLEDWLKTIDVKAERVLDIGGSANPVKGRVKGWSVEDYVVMDNNCEKGKHDKWRAPDVVWDVCQDIISKTEFGKAIDVSIAPHICKTADGGWSNDPGQLDACGFDCVFMLEVAEYLYAPHQVFSNIFKMLRAGGVLYVSFPFVYPQHEPVECDCLRYTPRGADMLLKKAGFKIIEHKLRLARSDSLAGFYSLDRMRPSKSAKIEHGCVGSLIKAGV